MRRALLVLALAVAALAAVVVVRPPHAPPLYDGLGFPDEPYRWVAPPAAADRTPQPATTAAAVLRVEGGATVATQGFSAEQGPQIAFAVAQGAFAATGDVQVTAVPAAPPPPPALGTLASNLYTITAKTGAAAVKLAPGAQMVVNLRADQATKQAVVVCRRDGDRWVQLPTTQVGTDVYAARLTSLGSVAVVRLDPGVQPSAQPSAASAGAAPAPAGPAGAAGSPVRDAPASGPGAATLWIALGVVLVLLAAGLLVLRRRVAGGDPPADA